MPLLPEMTRRSVFGALGGLTASPLLARSVTSPSPSGRFPVMSREAPRRIFVESEFAPLRTVVLSQSELRLPDPDAIAHGQLDEELSVSPPEHRELLRQLLGKDHGEAMPERQRRWEAERDAFRQVLEKHGVEVLRPRLLTRFEKAAGGKHGYANAFVRDPWFTVGNFVIEGSLRFLERRSEVLPCRDIFRTEVYPSECNYVAVPQPEILPLEIDNGGIGPFLEGGDVLVYQHHVFVGVSGRASTMLGAEWLRKLVSPHGYTVEIVHLKPYFLHLDCVLGLVREGVVVVHEDGLLNGLPAALRDWTRIPVTRDDAMNLGTNGLPINAEVYVTDPVFRRTGDAIARHGVTVEYIDFSISRGFGGSFRCTTQPLLRA